MTPPDFLPQWPPAANSLVLFALLLLAGALGGRLAATTRVLPAITGYIAIGFLLGPGGLHVLNAGALADARLFADVSLGVVVFELGRRLDLQWARHDRWLLPMGLAESLLSFAGMFLLLRLLSFPALEAGVIATFGIATAPAVVLLVTRELRADGPVTRRALWHVALNNIVAILGLAFLLPFIEAQASGATWSPVARSLWVVGGSFLLGYAAFRLMTFVASIVGKGTAPQFILTVATIILTVGVAQSLKLSVLLALLVLGICAHNLDRHHRLIDVRLGDAGELFFVVLFVLTGATLRVEHFGNAAWIGLAFVAARFAGKGVALLALCRPARVTVPQAGALALTLMPIGGLALGMTQPIFDVAPEFGARLAAIVASGIALLHILGPIATRYALLRVGEGEAGARN
ncbi:MAG TPA: cation:proton antiporter [Casimicrobiaceae bacterium]|nr:cation:proton antiporter [Casimicrobiaceae bacterium]